MLPCVLPGSREGEPGAGLSSEGTAELRGQAAGALQPPRKGVRPAALSTSQVQSQDSAVHVYEEHFY